jgi:hypothetical protein
MRVRVKDLSPRQKQAAEVLLGHPVSDQQSVAVKSLDPAAILPARLSPAERVVALRALEARFASRVVAEVSPEEEDALVREAFESTRQAC